MHISPDFTDWVRSSAAAVVDIMGLHCVLDDRSTCHDAQGPSQQRLRSVLRWLYPCCEQTVGDSNNSSVVPTIRECPLLVAAVVVESFPCFSPPPLMEVGISITSAMTRLKVRYRYVHLRTLPRTTGVRFLLVGAEPTQAMWVYSRFACVFKIRATPQVRCMVYINIMCCRDLQLTCRKYVSYFSYNVCCEV